MDKNEKKLFKRITAMAVAAVLGARLSKVAMNTPQLPMTSSAGTITAPVQ